MEYPVWEDGHLCFDETSVAKFIGSSEPPGRNTAARREQEYKQRKTCVFCIVDTLNNKLYESFSFVFNIAFYV